jgi:hypothetical protein
MKHYDLSGFLSTSDVQPEHGSFVLMLLGDGSIHEGYYAKNKWHYIAYHADGSMILSIPVEQSVSKWHASNSLKEVKNFSLGPKTAIKELLSSFDAHVAAAPIHHPIINEFWMNATKRGSYTCIHSPMEKHDEFIYQIWNAYLSAENSTTQVKQAFLCTTFRNPKSFYFYALNQRSRFHIHKPLNHPYTRCELMLIRETADNLATLPLNLLGFRELNPDTLRQLNAQIMKKNPSLVIIEALLPPTSDKPTIPTDITNKLENIARRHHTSIVVVSTSPDI